MDDESLSYHGNLAVWFRKAQKTLLKNFVELMKQELLKLTDPIKNEEYLFKFLLNHPTLHLFFLDRILDIAMFHIHLCQYNLR
jgi:hypothetical protein